MIHYKLTGSLLKLIPLVDSSESKSGCQSFLMVDENGILVSKASTRDLEAEYLDQVYSNINSFQTNKFK